VEARLPLLSGRSASIGEAGGIGKPLLVRLPLDHDQPPPPVSVRYRDGVKASRSRSWEYVPDQLTLARALRYAREAKQRVSNA